MEDKKRMHSKAFPYTNNNELHPQHQLRVIQRNNEPHPLPLSENKPALPEYLPNQNQNQIQNDRRINIPHTNNMNRVYPSYNSNMINNTNMNVSRNPIPPFNTHPPVSSPQLYNPNLSNKIQPQNSMLTEQNPFNFNRAPFRNPYNLNPDSRRKPQLPVMTIEHCAEKVNRTAALIQEGTICFF